MTGQRAPFRLLRTSAVTVSVLSLAAGAHVQGGGELPPVSVLAAGAALVSLGVVLLARWKLRAPALLGLLTAGQVLLHGAFSVLSDRAPLDAAPALHSHAGVTGRAPVHAAAGAQTHLPWDLETSMLTAHVIATVVTAVMLAKGEAALWALAAWLRPIPGVSVTPVLPVANVPVPGPGRALVRRRPVARAHRRRGPPAAAFT